MVHLTQKVMNFLLIIRENGGKITRKEQDMYDAVRYYIMVSYLRKNELITCDGVDDNNQKIWKFTQKGEKVADIIEDLRRTLYGEHKGDIVGQ